MSSLNYLHRDHTLSHFPVSQAEPHGLFEHVPCWKAALVFAIHISLVTVLWPRQPVSVKPKSHFLTSFLQAFTLPSMRSLGKEALFFCLGMLTGSTQRQLAPHAQN